MATVLHVVNGVLIPIRRRNDNLRRGVNEICRGRIPLDIDLERLFHSKRVISLYADGELPGNVFGIITGHYLSCERRDEVARQISSYKRLGYLIGQSTS